MKAIHIQTEYLKNPLGLSISHPRIFWNDEGGEKQTAFEIEFISSLGTHYSTGKVFSSNRYFDVPFDLHSRERVSFRIKLYDEKDRDDDYSEENFFERGLLNKEDFLASFITGDYSPKRKTSYPVDYFKKVFHLKKPVLARLYATSYGLYRIFLNGEKAGDFVLAPGSTDYKHRLQVQAYDVTNLLKEGENTLTAELADGWYRGHNGAKGRQNTYGKQTKLFYQLEVFYQDGYKEVVLSDGQECWSQDGPLSFADLRDGEVYDFNKKPSYQGKARKVNKFQAPFAFSNNVAVKEKETFAPVSVVTTKSGKRLVKFPENIAGYVDLVIEGKKGQKVDIALGELLDEDGELTLRNIQCHYKGKPTPLQEIHLILKEGVNHYHTAYFFGGFRYASIVKEESTKISKRTAIAVYSDCEVTGNFQCSNLLLNIFAHNTLRSRRGNTIDIPTDCPTRERMGWTGDSQVFFNTASYRTNYAPFARKHLNDLFDEQRKNGKLGQIVPFSNEDWFRVTRNGSVGWADAGILIPYRFYKRYGDERLLKELYPKRKKYASFRIHRIGKWGGFYQKPLHLSHKDRKWAVAKGQSYGEWAEPNDVCSFNWLDFASPHPEVSTAYTSARRKYRSEIALILDDKEASDYYLSISEHVKHAYQALRHTKAYPLDTDRQANLVRPLYFNLLDGKDTEFAKKRLIQALENYRYRLGTGFLSTPFILEVLAKYDLNACYKLLLNEERPGWLFMAKNDTTTVWEGWEGPKSEKGIASLNHYSKGARVEWLYKGRCGIKVEGQNHFCIEPSIGPSIDYASASYHSIYGTVSSSWKKMGGKRLFTINVPSNTTAEFVYQDMKQTLGPGLHEIEVE